jgi:hypothetical protein
MSNNLPIRLGVQPLSPGQLSNHLTSFLNSQQTSFYRKPSKAQKQKAAELADWLLNALQQMPPTEVKKSFFAIELLLPRLLGCVDAYKARSLQAKILASSDTESSQMPEIYYKGRALILDIFSEYTASTPPVKEVQESIRKQSNELLNLWKKLKKLLDKSEGDIQQRWSNATDGQRKALLRKTYPCILEKHLPDFKECHHGPANFPRPKDRDDIFKLPHINIADLRGADNFLLMVNSRGRNHPSHFAQADYTSIRIGRLRHIFPAMKVKGYTLLLSETTPEKYGQVLDWASNNQAKHMLVSGLGFTLGDGLLVLEIQTKTLRFLLKLSEAILDEASLSSSINPDISGSQWPDFGPEQSKLPTSLASIAATAPYRLPRAVDFRSLQCLVSAVRGKAEYHLRKLQEDPAYLWEAINEAAQHDVRQVLEPRSKRIEVLKSQQFWSEMISRTAMDAQSGFFYWDCLEVEFGHLSDMHQKYSSQKISNEMPPKEYLEAVLLLKRSLQKVRANLCYRFDESYRFSPELRDKYVWVGDALTTKFKDFSSDEWYLTCLLGKVVDGRFGDAKDSILTLREVLDEIDANLCDPSQTLSVSVFVSEMLTELGLVTHMERELDFLAWSSTIEHHLEKDTCRTREVHDERFRRVERMQLSWEYSGSPLQQCGFSSLYFEYPDNSMTNEVTGKRITAEARLDQIWDVLDKHNLSVMGCPFRNLFQSRFENQDPIFRTQRETEIPRLAPAPEPEIEEPQSFDLQHQIIEPTLPGTIESPVSDPELDSSEPSPAQEQKPQPRVTKSESEVTKNKVKLQPKKTAKDPEQAAILDTPAKFTIPVKQSSLDVFSKIMYDPFQSSKPGLITWHDFTKAMGDAGFGIRGVHGSRWVFIPVANNLGIRKPIILHDPHKSKVPPKVAREYAGHISYTYGWDLSAFVLRK